LAAALEAPQHPALGSALAPGVLLAADVEAALAAGADDVAVAVCFAPPAATLNLLRRAAERGGPDAPGLPCVVGATGFDDSQRAEIAALADRLPLLLAANFSVAANLLFHLAREAAQRLGPGYDAEIVELHHSAKQDAPSGTALRLAAAVAEGRAAAAAAAESAARCAEAPPPGFTLSRSGHTGPRAPGAIGVQALRGGDNPGEHTLLFLAPGERLELAHRATSRDSFARGALQAAEWLCARPPGLYDMEQVLGLTPAPQSS